MGTARDIADKPTEKNNRMIPETAYMLGYPTPFPSRMPKGAAPPMTVNGAAAATTMKMIAPTPR